MNHTNRVIAIPQYIKDELEAIRDGAGYRSLADVLEFELLPLHEGFVPLIERPLSELEALHKREPTRAGLRSAYLAKRAGVE
jgi:hypothetical protein